MKNSIIIFLASILLLSCKENTKKVSTESQNIESENKIVNEVGDTLNLVSWRSNVGWRADGINKSHSGKVTIKSGYIVVTEDKKILGGRLELDMNTIYVADLKGKDKETLENHLKGLIPGKEDHFFNVKKHPTATFEIIDHFTEEGVEYLEGDLLMKGINNPVEGFPVKITVEDNKMYLYAESFKIDRTDWGIEYASKTFFDDLKDDVLIQDFIKIKIKAVFDLKK